VNDIFSSEAIIKAAQGCNVFMYSRHLFSLLSHDINSNAMNPPPLELFKSVTDEERITKRNLRTEGVKSLFEASKAVGAKTFLHQSLIWVARPKGVSIQCCPVTSIHRSIIIR
jgi:pyruvate/2-oxoacid:ferredoxin oxidoreductase beta subunit